MPPPLRDPAFATAFKACAAEQGVQLPEPGEKPQAPERGAKPHATEQGGKPTASARPPFDALDRGKLDSCLSGKGFKRRTSGEHPPTPAAS
ncbi:MAG: hypothetical protein QM581_09020 [Pseudomonas sp.]